MPAPTEAPGRKSLVSVLRRLMAAPSLIMKTDSLKAHVFRRDGGRSGRSTPRAHCRGTVGDVGVEQGLNVVDKGVFEVDSGRLELEGDLRRQNTKLW